MRFLFLFITGCLALHASLIPQSGYSGRPGDGTCRDCHPARSLVPSDSSEIRGLPEAYTPETTYSCTLVVRYRGLSEWTFELATSDSNGNQAGALDLLDARHTQLDTFQGIQYLKNTLPGAYIGQPDSARWAFAFTSPCAGTGPVWFYWAAYFKNRKQGRNYFLLENSRVVTEAPSE
ncbi:MAG: choice-of-anchor V domain-containing protein [candidate division WOR-3 bacterium]